ncbi:hypothetical protein D0Y65_053034 [Glycine soja]|uniref:Uncharacterized protein n=1 Tax=Glycine soja TaxID=3848 RepID=A0A445F0L7_GLYSO|nr:hypothetical protein D0Y65_053034 [Glycine soja]
MLGCTDCISVVPGEPQTCAGAAILTDIVFWVWGVIVPFLQIPHLRLSPPQALFYNISCKHMLLFPNGWPYPFLELNNKWAPIWYLCLAVIHAPCYGVYYLIVRDKNTILPRLFPQAFLSQDVPEGICGLSFANKGCLLHIVEHNGVAYGVNIETRELLKEFKITKKSITSLAFSHDEKYLAIVSSRPRVISWEIGEEILKFPNDLGNVEHISISSDAKNLVTSDFEDQHEAVEGVLLDDDLNEPTMGEKLASLSVLDGNKSRSDIEQESSIPAKSPSADSVHVLLKQALNADDRTLLLDCLFTQNEKVVVTFQRPCCSRSLTLCSIIISSCIFN